LNKKRRDVIMATKAKKPAAKKEEPKTAAPAAKAETAAKPKRPQQTFLDECAG
jgi:hypothetical protein